MGSVTELGAVRKAAAVVLLAVALHLAVNLTLASRITRYLAQEVHRAKCPPIEVSMLIDNLERVTPLTVSACVVSSFSLLFYWLLSASLLVAYSVLWGRDPQWRPMLAATGFSFCGMLPWFAFALGLALFSPLDPPLDPMVLAVDAGTLRGAILELGSLLRQCPPASTIRVLTAAATVALHVLFALGYARLFRGRFWEGALGSAVAAGILQSPALFHS